MRLAQIGSFDVENYGDLLFPMLLKQVLPDAQIDLFSPLGGPKPFESETTVYPLESLEERIVSEGYEALIVGGGDLLRLDAQVVPGYKHSYETPLSIWQLPALLGSKYRLPVLFNAPGAPYHFRECEKPLVRQILQSVEYLSVRDGESGQILEECGVENVHVVPDTIFAISRYLPQERLADVYAGLVRAGKVPDAADFILVQHNRVNLQNEPYLAALKRLLEKLTGERGRNVVFMPIGYVHHDEEFLEKLYDPENPREFFITEKLTPVEMLSVAAHSSGYIGTSLHGAITAYSYHRPILILNVQKRVKVGGFLELVHREDAEVKDIGALEDIFEQSFQNVREADIEAAQSLVEAHFKTLKSLLSVPKKPLYNYESDLLVSVYEQLAHCRTNRFSFAGLYLDYGGGYHEEDKKEIRLDVEGDRISFSCELTDKRIQKVRIDPIEGNYIRLTDLSVQLDGKKLDCRLGSAVQDGGFTFLTTDPTIEADASVGALSFSCRAEILDYDAVSGVLQGLWAIAERERSDRKSEVRALTDALTQRETELQALRGEFQALAGEKQTLSDRLTLIENSRVWRARNKVCSLVKRK